MIPARHISCARLIRVAVSLPVLSTYPLHTNSGCGKERRILTGPWLSAKAALVRNYVEVSGPVPADSRQCDPINSVPMAFDDLK